MASAGTSTRDGPNTSIQRPKQRVIGERFGGLDEELVSCDQCDPEKIET